MASPNFLVVLTDTQPTAFLGCYGTKGVRTPCIDSLAAQGVRFNRAYTTSPLCTPARAGLFTGMMPSMSGAYANAQPLGGTVRTMGQRFERAGYRCAFIGKWHLDGYDYFGTGECPDGWEEAYWYDGRRYLVDLDLAGIAHWRSSKPAPSAFTWGHRIADRAERFLAEQSGSRPWLLVTSFDEPHHPFTCPQEYIDAVKGTSIPLGPSAFDTLEDKPEHQREWRESYLGVRDGDGFFRNDLWLGCNSFVDAQIGRVVAQAQAWSARTGAATWIIFTTDHGDHLGTHGIRNKGPTAYEANARIPLIVVPPDGRGAGTVQASVVSHADILPTMLRAAGLSVPAILDGRDFLDLLGSTTVDTSRQAVVEYTRYEVAHDGYSGLEPLRALIQGRWKLVLNLHRTDELYDMENDPHELHNCIGDQRYVEDRDRMHDALLDWMDTHIDPQRGRPWQCRAWRDASRLRWQAPIRPTRDDGVRPPYLVYETGQPTDQTMIQL